MAGLDTGPQFAFNFGPGVRVHQFGGPRPRARPRATGANGQPTQPEGIASTIMGLLPVLLLLVFPLLSSLFSGFGEPATPHMEFDVPRPPYTFQRSTPEHNVAYFVNPNDVRSYGQHDLHDLDKKAELFLIRKLATECDRETAHQRRLVEDASGFFFQDAKKMERAKNYEKPSCKRFEKLRR